MTSLLRQRCNGQSRYATVNVAKIQERIHDYLGESLRVDPELRKLAGGNEIIQGKEWQMTTSVLKNGLQLQSVETHLPVSSVEVVIGNGGTRWEDKEQRGIGHVFKNFVFRSTQTRTGLKLTREMENRGSNMYAINGRDAFILGADFLRGHLGIHLEYLSDTLQNPLFAHYEMDEVKNHTSLETCRAQKDGSIQSFEELHRMAYRHGLGNSVYCSLANLHHLKKEHLHTFSNSLLSSPSTMKIMGVGVHHQELEEVATHLFGSLVEKEKKKGTLPQFFGGEIHHEHISDVNHYRIGFGVSGSSRQEIGMALLYNHLLGGMPAVQWGGSGSTLLSEARIKARQKSISVGYHSFLAHYADSHLLGLHIQSPMEHTPWAVENVLSSLQASMASITPDQLTFAKNSLHFNYLASLTHSTSLLTHLSNYRSPLSKLPLLSTQEMIQTTSSITVDEITQFARKLFQSSPAIASYGRRAFTPYFDSISSSSSFP